MNSQKQESPTPRQLELIATLINERAVPHEFLEGARKLWRKGRFSQDVASMFLSSLAEFPRNSVMRNLEPGFYTLRKRLFVVSKNSHSVFMLTPTDGYVTASEFSSELNSAKRISKVQALRLSSRSGRCLACGRPLNSSSSIARGIGPKCAEVYK